jgi:hypothetical protein
MKKLVILTILFTSNLLFAGDLPSETHMSNEQQKTYLDEVAKEIRKVYWISGHQDVSSGTEFVTKKVLDDHVKKDNRYESPLDSDQVAELYRCYYKATCELYVVYVSGSYWGGYGESAHFIQLYTDTRKHFEISHTIYAE